ncbi:hypothetical protein E2C01_097390 [Portunus trituberculatus]|uniref:Uncharacterized protein n=1 Tax=Portunus trituberculatus TaxID=210409 RepID=A0A5B7KB54_PORTR|nr:hypothetical protein [Portunus trituberculatus]
MSEGRDRREDGEERSRTGVAREGVTGVIIRYRTGGRAPN